MTSDQIPRTRVVVAVAR